MNIYLKELRHARQLFLRVVLGVLVSVLSLSSIQPALATTYTVCASGCSFTTIQAAIDAAASGDTITVSAGTYTENLTLNGKYVTLQGAGSGSNAASNTIVQAATASSATILVSTGGPSVAVRQVISGMRFTGTTSNAGGIQLAGPSFVTLQNVTSTGNNYGLVAANITDLIISGSSFSSNTTSGWRMGEQANLNGLSVTNSHFDNNTIQGIVIFANVSVSSTFTNVYFADTTFNNNGQKGFYTEKLNNALFERITVSNSGTDLAYNFNNGIDINLKYGSYNNIEIRDALITGSGVTGTAGMGAPFPGAAIAVKTRNDGDYSGNPASLTNFKLTRVDVINNPAVGIRFGEQGKNNAGPTTPIVEFSRIVGNGGVGLVNTTTSNVDAENNWWGCNEGPNTTDCETTSALSSGTIDANPWLVLKASASPGSIFVNSMSTITGDVTDNSDTVDSGGYLRDGTSIGFALVPPPLGTLSVATDDTASGLATSDFTAGGTPGTQDINVTLDNETVTTSVVINGLPPALNVTKTVYQVKQSNGTLRPGITQAYPTDTVIYGIAYDNISGAGPAANTQLVETVPTGTRFVTNGSTSGWSCSNFAPAGSTCIYNLGTVAAGASGGTINFAVQLTASMAAGIETITNTVTIRYTGNPSADTSQVTINVIASPDLRLTKTANVSTIAPGGTITYTLSVSNLGNQAASGAQITDTVPANTTVAASNPPGWDCPNGSPAGTICKYTLGATQTTVQFKVTVKTPLASGTRIVNAASVSSTEDSNLSNNSATVSTVVTGGNASSANTMSMMALDGAAGEPGIETTPDVEATPDVEDGAGTPDLALILDSDTTVVSVGQSISYRLSYANVGTADAVGVHLAMTVPEHTTFDSSNSSVGWDCADGGAAGANCTFDLVAVSAGTGDVATFSVVVDSDLTAEVLNIDAQASLSDDGTDPKPDNNGSSLSTYVEPPALIAPEGTPDPEATDEPGVSEAASNVPSPEENNSRTDDDESSVNQDDEESSAQPEPVEAAAPRLETFLCANLETQSSGAMLGDGGIGNLQLNGLTGDTYCHIINTNGAYTRTAAEIGNGAVIEQGVQQAVDVFGLVPGGYSATTFTEPVRLCLKGNGSVYFISAADGSVQALSATVENGYVCVNVPGAGKVVLAGGSLSGVTSAPVVDSTTRDEPEALSECTVQTTYMVRLRDAASTDSNVQTTLPYDLTLTATARVEGWYRVIYGDGQGWVSAEFVQPSGDCGG